ncbi:hypothetical protein [Streptomyces albidoflavus]|nr:hypothetical protein [Streptomyces albidoflavus]
MAFADAVEAADEEGRELLGGEGEGEVDGSGGPVASPAPLTSRSVS